MTLTQSRAQVGRVYELTGSMAVSKHKYWPNDLLKIKALIFSTTVVYSPQESEENIRTKSSPDGENIHETIKISKMSTRKIHSHHSTSTRKRKTSVDNKYYECSILKYS